MQLIHFIKEIKKITDFWLNCHGSPEFCKVGNSYLMGNRKSFYRNNNMFYEMIKSVESHSKNKILYFSKKFEKVSKIHFNKLASKANIILLSCSIGADGISDNQLNLAEWFQYYAGKKRKVFAPKTPVTVKGINFTNIGKKNLNVTFKDISNKDCTAKIAYNETANKVKDLKRQAKKEKLFLKKYSK